MPSPESSGALPSPAGESAGSGEGGNGGRSGSGSGSGSGNGEGSVVAKREAPSPSNDVDDVPNSPGDTADGSALKKRKKTGPGSRGVAYLTPEQLEKKRANDREAQKAIRQRTKNQIKTLERRIQELTSQKPYQELQAVVRAKEAVEQENAEIKRRLASVIAMLQPLASTDAPSMSASTLTPSAIHSHSSHGEVSAPTPTSTASRGSVEPSPSQHWPSSAIDDPTKASDPDAAHRSYQQQQPSNLQQHGLVIGPERLELEFILQPSQQIATIQSGINGAQDSPQYQHIPMKHDWTGVTNDQALRRRPRSWDSPASVEAGSWTGATQGQQGGPGAAAKAAPPMSAVSVKNCGPTCPLDTLLIDFLSERRQRAQEGVPAHEVVGPRYPSVSSLLNPANSVYSHPLSKFFTDILATFPDISTLPERVAVLYIMFLVMRWQISPTVENYERLPDWMQPTPAQVHIPHPAWIDHLPYPRMREKLSRHYNPTDYLFDNFFVPFTTTISLSWPYDETDTLLRSPDTDELLINPVFERHLRNLDNWKLGDAFVKAFPTLADTCNIHDKPPRR